MAVPKRRVSKARRDKRRASVDKVARVELSRCPQCNKLKRAHRVCLECGYYNGRLVIVDEA